MTVYTLLFAGVTGFLFKLSLNSLNKNERLEIKVFRSKALAGLFFTLRGGRFPTYPLNPFVTSDLVLYPCRCFVYRSSVWPL